MDIPLISPRKLDQYVDRYPGIWIVDVRSGEEYRRSHIRHAVNIPYEPGQIWKLPRGKIACHFPMTKHARYHIMFSIFQSGEK